jgi:GH25 family lysozyme M1 (1,4-beta-N-acetylmuramidase)
MTDPILGIDISKWNPDLDYQALYDGGVRFAFVKLTSGNYSKTKLRDVHINGCRKVGILVGGYHWADPLANDQSQLDYFLSELNLWKIKAACIDVEQYWADWNEFNNRLPITKFLDPTRISQNAYNLHTGVMNNGLNGVIYSRETFIESYAKPIKLWIPPLKSWWAYWYWDPATGRIKTTWEYLKSSLYPRISAPFTKINAGWRFWQWSGDKFILPGTGGNPIDLNFFPGTMEELEKFMGGEAIPNPPPTPLPQPIEFTEFKSLTNGLRIRKDPNTSATIKGQLVYGETLSLADNVVVKSNGYDWVPCKVWVAKGKTDGTKDFGKLS